jgi:serine/threonine protein kinase
VTQGSPESFGPYLVYEELGIGGMARVHRAERSGIEGFSKVVALKRMLPQVAASEDLVKSFVREARLASYLRHENVAQTYELGKVGETYFIAMELITGRNLIDVMARCQAMGPMPIGVALNIVNQICDALEYAHNLCDDEGKPLGIIHRDVSPSNIIVAEGGVVKLIDFGIAKTTSVGMQTMSFSVKGKFGYMAPEYIFTGAIDARADLFAVGIIAYELLTNQPLFTAAEDLDTMNRLRTMVIPPPSQVSSKVPPELDLLVMTALERDPNQRWQAASAMRTAFATVTRRLGLSVTNSAVAQWFDDPPSEFEVDARTQVDVEVPMPTPVANPPPPARPFVPPGAAVDLQPASDPALVPLPPVVAINPAPRSTPDDWGYDAKEQTQQRRDRILDGHDPARALTGSEPLIGLYDSPSAARLPTGHVVIPQRPPTAPPVVTLGQPRWTTRGRVLLALLIVVAIGAVGAVAYLFVPGLR